MQGWEIMDKKFIGIDVSKNSFDLCVYEEKKVQHWENNNKMVKKCAKQIEKMKPKLIVLEATGGYELEMTLALQQLGLPVAVVNPRRIRDFAKSLGIMAKTDKVDAKVIARFASVLQPPTTKMITKSALKLKALTTRRTQLVKMRTSEYNRLEHAKDREIRQSLNAVIKCFTRQIEKIDQEIETVIYRDPEMKAKAEFAETIPGIGKVTAAMLVSGLPELGTLTRREITSLTGLAPIARDSGKYRGRRMTGGGRANIRASLFMPTLVAIQHNPVIRKHYQQLLENGKAKMTAVTACMRKIVIILNVMIAKKECWKF